MHVRGPGWSVFQGMKPRFGCPAEEVNTFAAYG
jgi:hypothetical protein